LTKVYNERVTAVQKLNLGVAKGETFGLLGVNGAGKTTTFKMITGDIPITSGDVYLCRNSVKKNLAQVYKNVGYCPQFDAVIEQLTGRETIQMFANLRGIKETHIDRIVDNLAQNLLFTKHIDKKVGMYSGGNKRKLSTAVAMLGNPAVVFFDEPTTGLDPVARRHVWNAVNRLRESGTSVVITSHCMEECEALCSRLAIMVDGRFRCLGSPQHLKNKFGEGYSIVAQLNYTSTTSCKIENGGEILGNMHPWEVELQGLKDFIRNHFPHCELKDSHPGFVQYHVPANSAKWAQLFAVMEKAKEKFDLEAYSVGQTSLEQVFFNFTKLQESFEE
jgi:ATP-binding cassette subfamily A (ABC1) protein 3